MHAYELVGSILRKISNIGSNNSNGVSALKRVETCHVEKCDPWKATIWFNWLDFHCKYCQKIISQNIKKN